jgi:hypothetical protein
MISVSAHAAIVVDERGQRARLRQRFAVTRDVVGTVGAGTHRIMLHRREQARVTVAAHHALRQIRQLEEEHVPALPQL